MKILFYDLETSGLDYTQDAIIQFAGILVEIDTDSNIQYLDKFNYEMQPFKGKRIDLSALEINGYTPEKLKELELPIDVYNKFCKFLEKYCDKYNKLSKITLCGYNNLHFDNDFLRTWFKDCGDEYFGSWFWSNSIDVMSEASRYLLHYRPALFNFKLGNVAKILDINVSSDELHDAFYDIKLTMKIFLKLIKEPMFKEWSNEEAERIYKIKIEQEKEPKESRKESIYLTY